MNNYNDDTIILSAESVNTFLNSLLFDKESRIRRDNFIADVRNNIVFSDDGSMVVDIPNIEFKISQTYKPVETIVNTHKPDINVSVSITVKTTDYLGKMPSYTNPIIGKEYSMDKMCKSRTHELDYVA